MPGMFGGIGCTPECFEILRNRFDAIWGKCESISTANGFLGGHAFADASALHVTNKGLHFAVDGEAALYKNAVGFAQCGEPTLFHMKEDYPELDATCKGNLALLDHKTQTLYLATELTGSFPLYYAEVNGGLLFSSHLRPLAKVVEATTDSIGVVEFLLFAYILSGRTFFKGIRRLLPGQVLVYEPTHSRLKVYETSRAWAGSMNEVDFNTTVANAWVTLGNAVRRSFKSDQSCAIMTSAGWDSRLLLASVQQHLAPSKLRGYSHGDLQSRELFLTTQILRRAKITCQLEPLDNDLYAPDVLQQGFDRVENLIYPHWHRAGSKLAKAGVGCVTAGICGEIIGGHYNRGRMLGPVKQMFFVASELLGRNRVISPKYIQEHGTAIDVLRLDQLEKPWYLHADFWHALPQIREEINADIEMALQRFEVRGVSNVDQLLEAFVTEFHAAQNIGAQLLSCRAETNIANPFWDQEMYNLSGRIPLQFKIHNSLSQAIIRRYAHDLLPFPTAAVLVSAGAPILAQEISRVLRKMYEEMSWKIHIATHGRARFKFLGWSNFEFLRDGKVLQSLTDNFNENIVDKPAIEQLISKVKNYEWKTLMHPVMYQMMKISTMDLMLK